MIRAMLKWLIGPLFTVIGWAWTLFNWTRIRELKLVQEELLQRLSLQEEVLRRLSLPARPRVMQPTMGVLLLGLIATALLASRRGHTWIQYAEEFVAVLGWAWGLWLWLRLRALRQQTRTR